MYHMSVDEFEGIPVPPGMKAEERRAARHAFVEALITKFPGNTALVYVDGTDVKQYNDTQGYDEGDNHIDRIHAVLNHSVRQETERNRRLGRDPDTVLRGGVFGARAFNPTGDEFMMFLSGMHRREDLLGVMDRTRRILATESIKAAMGGTIHRPGESAKRFITRAEFLMKRDKLEQVPVARDQGEAILRHIRYLLGHEALQELGVNRYNIAKHIRAMEMRDAEAEDPGLGEDTVELRQGGEPNPPSPLRVVA